MCPCIHPGASSGKICYDNNCSGPGNYGYGICLCPGYGYFGGSPECNYNNADSLTTAFSSNLMNGNDVFDYKSLFVTIQSQDTSIKI